MFVTPPPVPVCLSCLFQTLSVPSVWVLKGYSSFQEHCPVAVEKRTPPETAGGGRVTENRSNKTHSGLQVRRGLGLLMEKIPLLNDNNNSSHFELLLTMPCFTFHQNSLFYLRFLTKFHLIGSIHQRLCTHIKEIKIL